MSESKGLKGKRPIITPRPAIAASQLSEQPVKKIADAALAPAAPVAIKKATPAVLTLPTKPAATEKPTPAKATAPVMASTMPAAPPVPAMSAVIEKIATAPIPSMPAVVAKIVAAPAPQPIRQPAQSTSENMLSTYRTALASFGDSQRAVAGGVKAMTLEMTGLAHAAVTDAGNSAAAMIRAKSLTDAVAIQLDFARRSVAAMIAGSARLSEIGVQLATDASRPIVAPLRG